MGEIRRATCRGFPCAGVTAEESYASVLMTHPTVAALLPLVITLTGPPAELL